MQQSVEDKFQYGPLTERLIAVSAYVATVYVLGRGILDNTFSGVLLRSAVGAYYVQTHLSLSSIVIVDFLLLYLL